jgi:hypothetical protein
MSMSLDHVFVFVTPKSAERDAAHDIGLTETYRR